MTKTNAPRLALILSVTLLAIALSGCISYDDHREIETEEKEASSSSSNADDDADGGAHDAAQDDVAEAYHPTSYHIQGTAWGTGEKQHVFDVPEEASTFTVDGRWAISGTGEMQIINPDDEIVAEVDGPGISYQLEGIWYHTDDVDDGTWTIHIDGPGIAHYDLYVTY